MNLEQIGHKLTEVANDVKWIKQEAIVRNGKFETHLVESDKFRHQVTRNTTWRQAFKIIGGLLTGAVGFLCWCMFYGK